MKILISLVFALGLLVAPTGVGSAHATTSAARCTTTSSGSCIRGGQFCPQASYNHAGYDAGGHRYVCKGDRVHPHWMR